jgi:short-subunit dehydrogenase
MKEGRTAIVTGASSGLGRAIAEECAARGWNLVLVALPESGLPAVAEGLASATGVGVEWLEADLTEPESAAILLDLVRGKGLEVGLLVNNAGIGEPGSFADFPAAYHIDTIALNAMALVRLCRLAVDEFGEGCGILNVASLGSLYAMPGMAVYSATKAFVRSFSLALRAELAGRNPVSALCPNAFATTPESAEYIARCGLLSRLACLSTRRIAREGLDGLERGRALVYPGAFNGLLAFLSRIVPLALAARAMGRYWGGFSKKTPTLWRPKDDAASWRPGGGCVPDAGPAFSAARSTTAGTRAGAGAAS